MIELNGTLLAQFINFFILVAILAKFAYKPILKVMQERQERIANDLEGAEKARISAEQLEIKYKEQLTAARREAQAIVDKAAKQAEVQTQAQLAEVREQIAREKTQAQAEIIREREKAMRELRQEVVSLSVAVAGKVIGKNIDAGANSGLIHEAIEKLDSKSVGL